MEDRVLIKGLKSKNRVIFDFVFLHYYSGLCAYSEKIVKDSVVAEDLVQDLFVTIWEKGEHLNLHAPLNSYLFHAIRNRSIDYLRLKKNKKEHANRDSKNIAIKNLSIYWFAEAELETLIEKSLNKLPSRCREIFIMSRFDGMSNQEIADYFSISKRTIEIQISNALKNLRDDLKSYIPLLTLFFIITRFFSLFLYVLLNIVSY